MTPAAHALPASDIGAFYRLAAARRDVRNGFRPDPVSNELLARVLMAGQTYLQQSHAQLRLIAATLGAAAAVAVSELIGFVGIIVPHAIRLTAGPSYRVVLPVSMIGGAAFPSLPTSPPGPSGPG
jgi:FecCD transport family